MSDARTREIANEQRFVDHVYERVEAVRAESKELARDGQGRAAAGPSTGLVERDAMVHHAHVAAEGAGRRGGGTRLRPARLRRRRDLSRRPARRARRGPHAVAHRLAGAGRGCVLPGHLGRTDGRGAPAGHHLSRVAGGGPRRRPAHPGRGRRAGRAGRRRAAGRAAPLPRSAHARYRHHDPTGAGRGDPGAGPRGHAHHRRARHRQDPGGTASGGVPALHRPGPVRRRRCPRGRAVDGFHHLHQPRAARPG